MDKYSPPLFFVKVMSKLNYHPQTTAVQIRHWERNMFHLYRQLGDLRPSTGLLECMVVVLLHMAETISDSLIWAIEPEFLLGREEDGMKAKA